MGPRVAAVTDGIDTGPACAATIRALHDAMLVYVAEGCGERRGRFVPHRDPRCVTRDRRATLGGHTHESITLMKESDHFVGHDGDAQLAKALPAFRIDSSLETTVTCGDHIDTHEPMCARRSGRPKTTNR